MIPVDEAQLQPIDVIARKRDRTLIFVYKEKCRKELQWCHEHSEIICNKANVLYKKYISGDDFRGKDRCLNFPRLEEECEKYNLKNSPAPL